MELIQRRRNAFLPSFVSYLPSKRQIFSRTVKFSGCVLDANRFEFNGWDTRHKCDSDQEAEDAVTISWRYLEVFVFDDIFHSNLARTHFGHQRSHLVLGSWIRNKATGAADYIFSLKKIYVPISISSISLPSLQSEGAGGLGRGRGTSSASMSLLNLIPFPPQTSKFYLEEKYHYTTSHFIRAKPEYLNMKNCL